MLSHLNIRISKIGPTYYELIGDIRLQLLNQSDGILHIGAHHGQEAEKYSALDKSVIWIEAIPSVYQDLLKNIKNFEKQTAYQALLGDKSIANQRINLSSNAYESSSIFQFGVDMNHKNLTMVDFIDLPMVRLDDMFTVEQLQIYNHWVIDVQGAEMLVLMGSGDLLNNVTSIEIEVSTKVEYSGGAKWSEIKNFLDDFGFFPLWLPKENSHEDVFFVKSSR
jgi:FkbM family methyltransferase